MKLYGLLLSLLMSFSVSANEGFTWLGSVSHSTHIPENVLGFIVVGIILIVIGIIYKIKISKLSNTVVPDKNISLRNFVELIGQFIYNQCKSIIGKEEADRYFPFVATMFIVILLSNLVGLIPGVLPPTEHLSTTFAIGVISFLFYNFHGIRVQGFFNYMKHFAGPLWYMAVLIFPLEIISNLFRPVSLALRLQGNLFGDHLVLSIFGGLAPLFVPMVFLLLGLLVCVVQAYVFTVLSIVYISLAVEHHDHDEHGAH